MPVTATSYCSPTLVLLAFDWAGGQGREDFLGFAISREPGFNNETVSWLPNRIDFDGPVNPDKPSKDAPIQKFLWWDARIDTKDRGSQFRYTIVPVVGTVEQHATLDGEATVLEVTIPRLIEDGVGTYFNRAVVSSQAFAREFPGALAGGKPALSWLANGLEDAVPDFLTTATQKQKSVEGVIYHLTDEFWIEPALVTFAKGKLSLVYNHTATDDASDEVIAQLVKAGHPSANFARRTKANIMHDKFLVRTDKKGKPEALLMGSANFTSSGLCQQANVLHTFESPKLAALYLERKKLLQADPALAATKKAQHGWSTPIKLAGGTARVFFPPESKPARQSLDQVVASIRAAESSVVFCCFDPTDQQLINACFDAGDEGKMMFGMVNSVRESEDAGGGTTFDPEIALFHRSRDKKDVAGKSAFAGDATPTGFERERRLMPKEDPKTAIRIHHKFILIDAETDTPILYTGSANLSNNALYNNDENLLEVVGSRQLADAYLAEFLRLYEHYRARMAFNRFQAGTDHTFKLTGDSDWAKKYFRVGSPEQKARLAMVQRA